MSMKQLKKNKMKTAHLYAVHTLVKRQDGLVLLIKRSPANSFKPGCWDLPGGTVEDGESFEEALRREVREEINITVRNVKQVYVYQDLQDLPYLHVTQIVYESEFHEGEIKLNPGEHDEYVWVSPEDISGFNCLPFLSSFFKHC